MAETRILVVDDDAAYAQILIEGLGTIGKTEAVATEAEFRRVFEPYKYDAILLDLRLVAAREGLDLLEYIQEEEPGATVLIISGHGDIATAVEALKKGARTFIDKSRSSLEEVNLQLKLALYDSRSQRRIRELERAQEIDEIIGDAPSIGKIRENINLVANDGEITVLIRGETGTGKELVARAVHRVGLRSAWPFVSVAFTDSNADTITSELFGHEPGAFTGANLRHFGFFEQAHKGVLFIDEIGDLPLDIQIKLLRVLDQKQFRRMGGKDDIKVDVQLVTATNRPLEEMVKEGRFREDLYYRLKVFEIRLPPLRERRDDIRLLVEYFLHHLRKKGRSRATGFTAGALDLLLRHDWPGNVRELKAAVESAALRSKLEESEKIARNHLTSLVTDSRDTDLERGEFDICRHLADVELAKIQEALELCGGKKTEAWKLLKYPNRFTMLRRVKKIFSDFPALALQFPDIAELYLK